MSYYHRFLAIILLTIWVGGGVAWAAGKIEPKRVHTPSDGPEEPVQEMIEKPFPRASMEAGQTDQQNLNLKAKKAAKAEKEKKALYMRLGPKPGSEMPASGPVKSESGASKAQNPNAVLGSGSLIEQFKAITPEGSKPKKRHKKGEDQPNPKIWP
jgi:hypothetical protein